MNQIRPLSTGQGTSARLNSPNLGKPRLADPFMRKNQVWFQKSLPPAIEAQHKKQKSAKHTEQMTLNLLNPKHIDRSQLSPAHYKQRLGALEKILQRADNQFSHAPAVKALLQKEKALIALFNDSRLSAVPC